VILRSPDDPAPAPTDPAVQAPGRAHPWESILVKTALIGQTPVFTRLLNAARMVAATDVSVLLIGESGSGKAAMAREIHAASRRHGSPFLSFACSGAPVGALAASLNQIEAPQATLYLPEVAELVPQDQAWLLRLLKEQDASSPNRPLRVIAGSSEDLGQAVQQGRFRRDLHLRLCVVPLEIPPLRERVLDIPALSAHFVALAAARHQLAPCRLRSGAERLLRRHLWPGNVRELANLCERLVILLPGADVRPENLPREVRRGETVNDDTLGFELPPQGIDLNGLEAELIRQALSLAGGNKSRAARLLGLTRDTLLYRLQKHVIPA
jgi:DNA-binding NtrC family response regulator